MGEPDPPRPPDDPVLPPPLPPPVPPNKGRGRGGGGNKYPPLDVTDDAGNVIGHVLVNANSHQLHIHCHRHGPTCSIGKTWTPWPEEKGRLTPLRASRGRPLAFLVGWLRLGLDIEAGEEHRLEHFECKNCKGNAAALADGTSALRLDARAYVAASPTLGPARAKERPLRDGEPQEPPGPF